jgi:hypothetical protein
MRNSFNRLIFNFFFLITAVTAQAADLSLEISDDTPAAQSSENRINNKELFRDERAPVAPSPSLEQPSVQKISKTRKKIPSIKKWSENKKAKLPKATIPSGLAQINSDTKTAADNSDVKRVEKWLEENETAERSRHLKKVREPVKKPTQSFTIQIAPEPTENKIDAKQPGKISPLNLKLPPKPPVALPAKKRPTPLVIKENKLAEDTKKFQSDLRSAESGEADAQLRAGMQLYHGKGVLQDRKNGLNWILKAAEKGTYSPESLHILGQAFFKGIDIEKDYVAARKWLSLLEDQSNYSAKNDLAYMMFNGIGGDKDYAKAFALYQQAARHGDVLAQANLGLMYATGSGTEIDKVRAYAWYSFAASQGNLAAATNRNDLLKDMSWEEINLAQKLSVELYDEVEMPNVHNGQPEQTKLKSRQLHSEKP